MVNRGIKGRIVNFSSITAVSGSATQVHYGAAKGAVSVQNRRGQLVRRVRVGANGGVNPVMFPGKGGGGIGRRQVAAGIHQKPYAFFRQGLQKFRPILVKPPVV